MLNKFKLVIQKHNEQPFIFGDDELIQNILEEAGITIEELPELAKYLDREYKVAIRENREEVADKIERLQYGVNFIFEASNENYKVSYKTMYIEQI
ncbi:hypothetical protein [Paenibacillus polymyxa]|uniref:hypothetical protein n=1 Tax=Paenibacillus polymyxa TaxID=1406 RepID=UPI0025B6DE01|nr:hypothetical protein [Paenibacillus polymyxa]MDN4106141.1 hypothetical protein [Paenibacillus polymyxa]